MARHADRELRDARRRSRLVRSLIRSLESIIDRGRHSYRNLAIGSYATAALVVAITAALTGWEFYRQGPMVLVALLLLTGGFYDRRYRSLSWERNLVLVALRDHPSAIVSATVERVEGFASLLNEREVVIATDGPEIVLMFKVADLPLVRGALAEHCPSITLYNFP